MCPTSIAVSNRSAPPHFGHRVALRRLAEICKAWLEVAARLDPAEMPTVAVRTRDELTVAQRVVGDDLAGEPDRTERAP